MVFTELVDTLRIGHVLRLTFAVCHLRYKPLDKSHLNPAQKNYDSIVRTLVLVVAVFLICASLVNIVFWVQTDRWVSHASGVYITLAKDLSEGIFYTDLYGEHGYRGTRYFPLYFSLHGLFIKLLGEPLAAGYLLGLLAGGLLLFSIFLFVRKMGGSVVLALAFLAAVLGCKLTQAMMTSIRGDILPAALNTCGLALFVGQNDLSRKRLVAISLFFILAFAAKVSAVFGVAAVCIVLLLRRDVKASVLLALITMVGFSLVIGISELFSQGRFIEVISSCASSGTSWEGIQKIPRRVIHTIIDLDWGTKLFLMLGLGSLALLPRNQRTGIAPVYFLLVSIVTIVTFSNPGLHVNHFLEPLVASVLLMASVVMTRKDRFEAVTMTGVGIALLIALAVLAASIFRVPPWKNEEHYQVVRENLAGIEGPILSDNSFIPILMGQKPFMLDAFMFRMLRENKPYPSFEKPLFDRIEERWFAAIVLEKWATAFPGLHFGEGFYESIERNYCLRQKTKQWLFYFRCGDGGNIHSHLSPQSSDSEGNIQDRVLEAE